MNTESENKSSATPGPPDGNTAHILHEKRVLSAPLTEDSARAKMTTHSRRGFIVGAGAAIAVGIGLRWLLDRRRTDVLERALSVNESLGRRSFRARALAPQFERHLAMVLRVNGTEGLSEGFDPSLWLQITGLTGSGRLPEFTENLSFDGDVDRAIEAKFPATPTGGLLLTLDAIKALPRVEMTTELKCIEGWSTVVNWTGARTSDFVERYQSGVTAAGDRGTLPPYVLLVTPDRGYYVGWDTEAFLHPQTLLCYEMNGAALSLPHGGPLRLVSTAKYGIKQIKRIGRISFTEARPPDFWAEQGYDWYSGL